MIAPLRRIVSVNRVYCQLPNGTWHTVILESLECGHNVVRRFDWFGPTHPKSRRCNQCLAAKVK